MKCLRVPCTGEMVDGYCDVCGMAPEGGTAAASVVAAAAPAGDQTVGSATHAGAPGDDDARHRQRAKPARGRPRRGPARSLPRPGVGDHGRPHGGREPALLRRLHGAGRAARREGAPGRGEGFCRKCGTAFSFTPKLAAGDLVAGQYEVVGCLAHGGLGWIYLARDHNVVRPLGRAQGPAQRRRRRRDGRRARRAPLPGRGRAPEHRQDLQLRPARSTTATSSWSTSADAASRSCACPAVTNGESPDPLPPAQAIAYMLEILPALGHLHRSGLLFCDFKPDNVIQTQDSLKLIDLGGVYRMGDAAGAVYGTVGLPGARDRRARPVGRVRPLHGRAHARGAVHRLQGLPDHVPVHAAPAGHRRRCSPSYDSLYRFLEKATAPDPDDRFQTADEMADQLLGVLREMVGAARRRPVRRGRARCSAATSARAPTAPTGDGSRCCASTATIRPPGTWRRSPPPTPATIVELLQGGTPSGRSKSTCASPAELIDAERIDEADEVLEAIRDADRWEWRAMWLQRRRRARPRAPRAGGDLPDGGLPSGARRAGAEARARRLQRVPGRVRGGAALVRHRLHAPTPATRRPRSDWRAAAWRAATASAR